MAIQKYASLSWGDTFSIVFTLLELPVYLTFYLGNLFIVKRQFKGIGRATALAAIRRINGWLAYNQLQWISGTTPGIYAAWIKRRNLPHTADVDLVDGATLYWITPKRTDKVVLYVHGGAFFAPLQDHSLGFWDHVRSELEKEGVEAGFAVLGYGLYPEARFPTQLRQAAVAVDHLLAAGVHPSNLHIVGDSAGANLVLQLLSQLLHPIDDNIGPVQALSAPIGSVYLMSPWVKYESTSKSFLNPEAEDIVDGPNVLVYGRNYVEGVPDSLKPYVEPGTAGPTWFNGIGSIVKRILITAGGEERFLDDIAAFADTLQKADPDNVDGVRFEIQEGGIHDDPMLDFLVSDTPSQLGTMTPMIVQWYKEQLSA